MSAVPARLSGRKGRMVATLSALLAASGLLAACGSAAPSAKKQQAQSSTSTTGSSASSGSPSSSTSATPSSTGSGGGGGSVTSVLPASVQGQYKGYTNYFKVYPNPYASYTPPKPPWKFCYNDSYQGNSWRKGALAETQKLVAQFQKAGLAKGGLTVTNSNNDVNTQIAQLNNEVAEGCNAIISIPSSPTGLCSAMDNAYAHNVLVVTDDSPVSCKHAENADFNEYLDGKLTAKAVVSAMGGKGNLLIVDGIPGLASNTARTAGAMSALTSSSGIHVVGKVTGNWTPSVAKSATLEFLTTHPQQIQGVWQSALTMAAVGQAFLQSGRPLPKMNGFAGSCSTLAFAHDNHIKIFAFNQAGRPAAYEAFEIAARMLFGEKPLVSTILYPLPQITPQNFDQWYKPSMTVQSSCYSLPPNGKAVANSYMSPLFKGGKPVSPAPLP